MHVGPLLGPAQPSSGSVEAAASARCISMLKKAKRKLFEFYYSRRPDVCFDLGEWAASHGIPMIDLTPPALESLASAAANNPVLKNGIAAHHVELGKAQKLIALANVRIRDEIGLVELPDQKVVLEGNWSLALLAARRSFRRRFDFRKVQTRGNVFSLLCLWGKEYYHWFYDVLPRLEASIDHLPSDTRYLINEKPRGYQLESLRAYGIGEDKLVVQPKEVSHEIQTLWFATPAGHTGFTNPDLLRKVSNRITGQVVRKEVTKKYYVSRWKAETRRVVNERDLRELLLAHEIEWISAEDLKFRDQVRCFSNAKAILGPHGAGLANLLFMPAGAKCGEMVGVDPSPCYEMSAASLGFEFSRLGGHIVDSNIGDMSIDPKTFAKWLEEEF